MNGLCWAHRAGKGWARSELNNGLAAIVAQSQLLTDLEPSLTEEGRTAAKGIHISATRLAKTVRMLGNLTEAAVVDYTPGVRMLDLEGAKAREE